MAARNGAGRNPISCCAVDGETSGRTRAEGCSHPRQPVLSCALRCSSVRTVFELKMAKTISTVNLSRILRSFAGSSASSPYAGPSTLYHARSLLFTNETNYPWPPPRLLRCRFNFHETGESHFCTSIGKSSSTHALFENIFLLSH